MRKVEGEEAVAGMDSGMNNHGAPAFFHTFRSNVVFIIDKIAVKYKNSTFYTIYILYKSLLDTFKQERRHWGPKCRLGSANQPVLL